MQLDDSLGERQTQTRALGRGRRISAPLLERIEDPSPLAFRDADARILDRDVDLVRLPRGARLDAAATA